MDLSELKTLELLIAVKRGGSYASAAKQLGVTRAAVSRYISNAENRLNVRLTRRTTRQVVLTEAAEELLRRVTKPLADIESALASVEEHQESISGKINISCSHAFGKKVLLPLLHKFNQCHPKLKFTLSFADHLENLVASPIDLTIRMGSPHADNIIARHLFDLDVVLVGSPKFKHVSTLHTLQQTPKIAFTIPGTQQQYPWVLKSPLGTVTEIPTDNAVIDIDSIEGLADLAMQGVGVAAVAYYLVSNQISEGKLVRLFPEYTIAPVPCYLCYYHREHVPQRIREIINFLIRELRQEDVNIVKE